MDVHHDVAVKENPERSGVLFLKFKHTYEKKSGSWHRLDMDHLWETAETKEAGTKAEALSEIPKMDAKTGESIFEAISAYNALDFDKAIGHLNSALKDKNLSDEEVISIQWFILLCKYGVLFIYNPTLEVYSPVFARYPLPRKRITQNIQYKAVMKHLESNGVRDFLKNRCETIDNVHEKILELQRRKKRKT